MGLAVHTLRSFVCAHTKKRPREQAWLRARGLIPTTHREPTERALLALGERDPVLDARGLDGVQQVLRLEGQVAFEDEHGLGDREERDRAHR